MTAPIDVEQQIRHAQRRAMQNWYDDGVPQMALGAFFLLVSALGWLAASAPPGSFLAQLADMILPATIIGGALIVRWIVQRVKTRVSEPRTGYFRFRMERRRAWLRIVLAAGVGGALGASLVFSQARWGEQVYALIQAGVFALAFGLIAYRFGVWRFAILALVSAVLPLLALNLGLEQPLRDSMVFGGVGGLLLLGGGWSFARFLRRHPLDEEGAHRG